MKTLKIFAAAIIAACLTSCGGEKKAEIPVVKPSTTDVSGDMDGCFKVVDKEYKGTEPNMMGRSLVTIELERTDKELPFKLNGRELWAYGTSGEADHVMVGFGIEFMDKEGTVIEKVSANASGMSGAYDSDESIALAKLKPGQTGSIRFHVPTGAVSFKISSAYEEGLGWNSTESSDDEDDEDLASAEEETEEEIDNSSSSKSGNWDALLTSYDQYVAKYISYMKRAANGDMGALAEYPALLEKAQELSEELENAKGEMTSAQQSRYLRITQKLTSAAAQ